jgi:large subunit ribosomal protein L6
MHHTIGLTTKSYFLRQSKSLTIQVLCNKKKVLFKGVYGSFFFPISSPLVYSNTEKKLWITDFSRSKTSFNNLMYILMLQASLGVLIGYRKQLNVVGIGYQAEIQKGNVLILKLGFSHLVRIKVPQYLEISCPKPRIILLKGINLQKINNFAYVIRQLKLPSAYKEKGIYLSGELVVTKQGKKT